MKSRYSVDQLSFFSDNNKRGYSLKSYSSVLTVLENRKGILDVDTVKGCTFGMKAHPQGGCYGECYAQKIAARFGFDFGNAVSRRFLDREHMGTIIKLMNGYKVTWYRIGTSGDPSHDWANTMTICRALRHTGKTPVIVTKHWTVSGDYDNESQKQI